VQADLICRRCRHQQLTPGPWHAPPRQELQDAYNAEKSENDRLSEEHKRGTQQMESLESQ
jgi:hypothetical protein